MKLMVLSDPHQQARKWELLCQAVIKDKPEIVAIAGDLLPKDGGTLAQISFADKLRNYAELIKKQGAELIMIPGNDDNRNIVPVLEEGDATGLWHHVADRVKKVKGSEFCGCPWVKDHPFGYKYWVAAQTPEDIFINPFQISEPLTINTNNEIETIKDYRSVLANKPAVSQILENLASRVENIKKSIWLIHDPPAGLQLDLCGSGDYVGSSTVAEFLKNNQPLLSVHGHIHEAPLVNGNIWQGRIGKTLCIQAGQPDGPLHYVTFDLQNSSIENLTHSIYGKSDY